MVNAMDGQRELVGLPVAKKVRGVNSATVIWKEVRDGTFPTPVVVNGRRYWFCDELEVWQQNLPRIRKGLTRTPKRRGSKSIKVKEAVKEARGRGPATDNIGVGQDDDQGS